MELTGTVRIGEARVDLEEQKVYLQDNTRSLTPIEARLVGFLAARRGTTHSREQLLTEVWGYAVGVNSRAVDHAMVRLRRKIESDSANPRWFTSTRGGGYRLEPQPTAPDLLEESSSYIERGRELERITVALEAERVVVLLGLGGIGKTRLALRTAQWWREQGGEVAAVGLGGAQSEAEVAGRVAHALGVDVKRLADALEGRQELLVVLDEVEALSDGKLAWVRSTMGPRFLLTSQRPLSLSRATIEIGPLSAGEATALLLARSSVPLTPGEAAPLVAALQGVPFALELAARWLGALTPAELLARLDLLGSSGGMDETLSSTLIGSWRGLSLDARALLADAAQFSGAFSVVDLEGLARMGSQVPHALACLAELVSRGWLYRAGAVLGMYTVVRQFLREQGALPEDGPQRLSAWLLSWAPAAARAQRVQWNAEVYARLAAAHQDLQCAVAQSSDPEVAVPLFIALVDIGTATPLSATQAEIARLLGLLPAESPWAAQLHLMSASPLKGMGDLPGALRALEQAQRALPFSQGRDPGLAGAIDGAMASLQMDLGGASSAVELSHKAIAALTRIGDWQRSGLTKCILGRLVGREDVDAGIALLLDALRDLVRVGNPSHMGRVHGEIARMTRTVDHERRLDHYKQAEALFRSVGDHHLLATLLANYAGHLLHIRDHNGARAAAEECKALNRALGEAAVGGMGSMVLCGIHLDQEAYAAALDHALAAQITLERTGSLVNQSHAHTLVGFCELGLGRWDRAIVELERAIDAKLRSGGGGSWPQAGVVLARAALGDLEGARALLPKANLLYQPPLLALLSGEPVLQPDPEVPCSVDLRVVAQLARTLQLRPPRL